MVLNVLSWYFCLCFLVLQFVFALCVHVTPYGNECFGTFQTNVCCISLTPRLACSYSSVHSAHFPVAPTMVLQHPDTLSRTRAVATVAMLKCWDITLYASLVDIK